MGVMNDFAGAASTALKEAAGKAAVPRRRSGGGRGANARFRRGRGSGNAGFLVNKPEAPEPIDPGESGVEDLKLDPTAAAKNPDATNAKLTRNQYQLFKRKFKTHEDRALALATDPTLGEGVADGAGEIAAQRFADTEGQTARRLSRAGMAATPDQQRVIDRKRGLRRAAAVGGAKNNVRDSIAGGELDNLGNTIAMGNDIQASGASGLSSAASMANARKDAGRANKAAGKKAAISAGLAIASMFI